VKPVVLHVALDVTAQVPGASGAEGAAAAGRNV